MVPTMSCCLSALLPVANWAALPTSFDLISNVPLPLLPRVCCGLAAAGGFFFLETHTHKRVANYAN